METILLCHHVSTCQDLLPPIIGEWLINNNLPFEFVHLDDLWESLGHASKKPVGDVMTTWTKQMGFPVISVSMEKVLLI